MSASPQQDRSSTGIAPAKVRALLARERERYAAANPRSRVSASRANEHMMFGVPLH